ncbi:MAG TPA: potassium channel family protein [Gemmatimonadaceae bacterium]|jgi:voltage-gated potassium channel|nr:potassium channel family protein [Gemmatimonadaceae bacterium]
MSPRTDSRSPEREALDHQRHELLQHMSDVLETPMVVLGFTWLVLLILSLVRGLTPYLQTAVDAIWVIFILYFLLELFLAPAKWEYLKHNWLTVISLFVPALRVFRIVRVFRVVRVMRAAPELQLVRVVGSINRGMAALKATFGRRGFGYVVTATALVTLAGAAGMYAFEHGQPSGGFETYGSSLWWTAMIMTTMGSQAWPATPGGRMLALILALYAFTVFGYVTATLASYFIDRDAEDAEAPVAGAQSVDALRSEVEALRADIQLLMQSLPRGTG